MKMNTFLHSFLCFQTDRSRSVVRVHMNINFEPSKINVFNKDCVRGGKEVTCMAAIVCVTVSAQTPVMDTQEVGK